MKKKFQIAILADSRFILCSIQMELSVNIIYDKNPTAMGGKCCWLFLWKKWMSCVDISNFFSLYFEQRSYIDILLFVANGLIAGTTKQGPQQFYVNWSSNVVIQKSFLHMIFKYRGNYWKTSFNLYKIYKWNLTSKEIANTSILEGSYISNI